ncbi:MAG: acyltransferase [Muribaculaceae bacterium]|nr:acyltransferase [Muribaculaceae bacterium]
MPRFKHIDALRGLAILLVVYVHLVNYGLFSFKGGWLDCAWSPAVIGLKFRMPLFFFLSGLLAYGIYTPVKFRKRVVNRLRKQLWPTIVVCLLFNGLCYWDGWHSLIYNKHNDQYWFTQSLVQIFLLYAVMARIFDATKASMRTQTIVLAATIAILLGGEIWITSLGKLPNHHFLQYSYLNRTVAYGQFFMLGVLARMWWDRFHVIFEQYWIYILITAYFIAGCIVDFGYTGLPTRMAGVVAVYGAFWFSRNFWGGESFLARGLSALGRHTLPVYLYHYIGLHFLMKSGWLAGLKSIYGGWWEIPVVTLLALTMALVCVLIDKFIKRTMNPIHTLVYG